MLEFYQKHTPFAEVSIAGFAGLLSGLLAFGRYQRSYSDAVQRIKGRINPHTGERLTTTAEDKLLGRLQYGWTLVSSFIPVIGRHLLNLLTLGKTQVTDIATPIHPVNPASNIVKTPPIMRTSSQLLPELKFTNTTFQPYDINSLKTYQLEGLDGRTVTKALYKANGVSNKYFDQSGVEYYLSAFTDNGSRAKILNVQAISGNSNFHVFEKTSKNQFLVAQPFPDFQKSKAYFEQQGLEVTHILGTGYIGRYRGNLDLSPYQYQYLNTGRLTQNNTLPPLEAGRFFYETNEPFGINGGFYTLTTGEVRYLDLKNLTKQQALAKIDTLKANPQVTAITANGFNITPSATAPKQIAQARAFMAFGQDGKLLGSFISPPVGLDDVHTLAVAKYGNKVKNVINLDGDFYAKALAYYEPKNPINDPLAERFKAGVWVVQPKNSIPNNAPQTPVQHTSDFDYFIAQAKDKAKDIFTPGKLWSKLQGWFQK